MTGPLVTTLPEFQPEILLKVGDYEVRNLVITEEKMIWLWGQISKYRSLFTDLTAGSQGVLTDLLMSPGTIWLEVGSVGVIYGVYARGGVELQVHVVFFDRNVANKTDVCKHAFWWLFEQTGVHRMTSEVPDDYFATKRLANRLGFRYEGTRKEAILRGGKWIDLASFAILRDEAEVLWAS